MRNRLLAATVCLVPVFLTGSPSPLTASETMGARPGIAGHKSGPIPTTSRKIQPIIQPAAPCPACDQVWQAVVGHQKIIADAAAALAAGEKKVEELKHEREELKKKAKLASSDSAIDALNKQIHAVNQLIKQQLALNKEMGDQIKKMHATVGKLTAEHQKCAAAQCAPRVKAARPPAIPAVSPMVRPPSPPPLILPPPLQQRPQFQMRSNERPPAQTQPLRPPPSLR